MEKKYKIIHFNEYCDDTYNKMENFIKNIKGYFNNSLNLCESILEQIKTYKFYLERLDYTSLNNLNELKNNEIFEGLKTKYDLFNEQITKNNNLSQSIIDEINNIITFDFFPEDESTLNNISSLTYQDSISNNYEEKFSSLFNPTDNKNNSNITNSNKDVENENDKENFLNSIENIIKYILVKCNDIMNEKEINKNNSKIRKEINYPKIGDNQNDYVNFLIEINEIAKDNLNMTNFSQYKLNIDMVKTFGNIY